MTKPNLQHYEGNHNLSHFLHVWCDNQHFLRPRFSWKYWKVQFVPRSKHSVSLTETDQLILYKEMIAVYSFDAVKLLQLNHRV
jgi:hypothetical protein